MGTRKNGWGHVWALFGPLMIALIVGNLQGIADIFWLGRLVGVEGVAVATVVFPVVVLGAQLAVGVSNATAILCSRAVGAKNDVRLAKVVATGSAVSMAVAVAVTLGVFATAPVLAASLNTPPELMDATVVFLRIQCFSFVPLFLYYQLSAAFRAQGDTMFQMWGLVAAVVLNMGLVPVFIVGLGPIPAMGTLGAAAANVMAYLLVLIGALVVLHIQGRMAFGQGKDINLETAREMAVVGLSSTLQVISPALSGVLMMGLVNQHGVVVVGGVGVASKVEAIMLVPTLAMNMTVTSLTGNAFGAGKPGLAWQHVRNGGVLCSAITVPLVVTSVLFSHQFTLAFVDDASLVPIVTWYLVIMAPGYLLNVLLALSMGMLNGDRRVLSGAAVFFIGYLAFCMPVAIFLSGTSLQEKGVWVAMSVSYLLMAVLATVLTLPPVRQRVIARRPREWESQDAVVKGVGIKPDLLDGPSTDEMSGARKPVEFSRGESA